MKKLLSILTMLFIDIIVIPLAFIGGLLIAAFIFTVLLFYMPCYCVWLCLQDVYDEYVKPYYADANNKATSSKDVSINEHKEETNEEICSNTI